MPARSQCTYCARMATAQLQWPTAQLQSSLSRFQRTCHASLLLPIWVVVGTAHCLCLCRVLVHILNAQQQAVELMLLRNGHTCCTRNRHCMARPPCRIPSQMAHITCPHMLGILSCILADAQPHARMIWRPVAAYQVPPNALTFLAIAAHDATTCAMLHCMRKFVTQCVVDAAARQLQQMLDAS